MKELTRRYLTYGLDNLPDIKNNSFKYRKIIGYTGSIVRRRIKGPIKIYWHYAFIYGFDKGNRLLLIENNDNGVECIFWEDFILDFKDYEMVHIETTPNNFNEIMNRAKERAKYFYHEHKNNCEHFVNYSVLKKLESIQVDNTKKGVNAFMLYVEARLIATPDPNVPNLLNKLNKIREILEIERGVPKFDTIVENKIKSSSMPLEPDIIGKRPKLTLTKVPLPKKKID